MHKFRFTTIIFSIILLSGCATSNDLKNDKYNHVETIKKENNHAVITNVSNSNTTIQEEHGNRTFINIRNSQNNLKNQKNNFLDYEKYVWDNFTQEDKHLFFKLLHPKDTSKNTSGDGSSWVYKNGKYIKVEPTTAASHADNNWGVLIAQTLKQSRFCNDRNFSPYIVNYFERLNAFAGNCSEKKNCLTDKNIRELQKSKKDVAQYFNEKLKKD